LPPRSDRFRRDRVDDRRLGGGGGERPRPLQGGEQHVAVRGDVGFRARKREAVRTCDRELRGAAIGEASEVGLLARTVERHRERCEIGDGGAGAGAGAREWAIGAIGRPCAAVGLTTTAATTTLERKSNARSFIAPATNVRRTMPHLSIRGSPPRSPDDSRMRCKGASTR